MEFLFPLLGIAIGFGIAGLANYSDPSTRPDSGLQHLLNKFKSTPKPPAPPEA